MNKPRYVVYPGLVFKKEDQIVYIQNQILGTQLSASTDLLKILKWLETPASYEEIHKKFSIQPATLKRLEQLFIVVKELDLPYLKGGLVSDVSPAIGHAITLKDLRTEAGKNKSFVIIGAPVDLAAGGDGGARHGPIEIRQAFPPVIPKLKSLKNAANPLNEISTEFLDVDFRRHYDLKNLAVNDLGNIVYNPGESLDVFGWRLQKVTEEILDSGRIPIVLGGDHSVARFSMEAVLKHTSKVGIIHFDAHHDLYPNPLRRLDHSNPFVYALGHKSLKVLMQVGLRTLETVKKQTQRVNDPRIKWVSSREIQSMSPKEVFKGLPRNIPYHLSFDIDCISPLFAQETGTRVSGGLTYYQAIELIDYASRTFNFVGADFVEVAGRRGAANQAAGMTARLMLQFFLGSIKFKKLKSYFYKYT